MKVSIFTCMFALALTMVEPVRSQAPQTEKIVPIGGTVTLLCPFVPDDLWKWVYWKKNDHTIYSLEIESNTPWTNDTRYEGSNHATRLTIKDIKKTDSGIYHCKVATLISIRERGLVLLSVTDQEGGLSTTTPCVPFRAFTTVLPQPAKDYKILFAFTMSCIIIIVIVNTVCVIYKFRKRLKDNRFVDADKSLVLEYHQDDQENLVKREYTPMTKILEGQMRSKMRELETRDNARSNSSRIILYALVEKSGSASLKNQVASRFIQPANETKQFLEYDQDYKERAVEREHGPMTKILEGQMSSVLRETRDALSNYISAIILDAPVENSGSSFSQQAASRSNQSAYNAEKFQTLKLDDPQSPTPASTSHLAKALCFMPSLTDLTLGRYLDEEFYPTLKVKASYIQDQTLELRDYQCPPPASSPHLAEALCSMPNLTALTLRMVLNEEFYSTLKSYVSSIQFQTLKLDDLQCPTPASSSHLAKALCSMPTLTDLTLRRFLNEEFSFTLKAMASSMQVQTLKLDDLQCPTPASSRHLAEALCYMPNLTDMTFVRYLSEEFYSSLKANASSIQVQTLKLDDLQCPTPASSHYLAEALCYMPNLTDLSLRRFLNEDFYPTLNAKATYIQVQTLKLHDVICSSPASSRHLAEAMGCMPKLIDLTLGKFFNEEFYVTLKSKASSIQVQTLKLDDLQCPTPASSRHLVEALCCMPNLTDLTLGMDFIEELYYTLKASSSSMQGCFPQVRKGDFRFNGNTHDLDSLLHTLECPQSLHHPGGSNNSDGSADSGNSHNV